MKAKTILQLADLAASRRITSHEITHSKRPSVRYRVLGLIKVDINGEWVMCVSYQDLHSKITYARAPDQFYNFSEVVL